MPIIDACIVVPENGSVPSGTARMLADTIAEVLGAKPGTVWVRVELLPQNQYAENGEDEDESPVFLKIMHADLPKPDHLAQEAREIVAAVAAILGNRPDLIHVEYTAPGRGRVAFGGSLLK